MAQSYLIDGYNLIHALGMIQKSMAPGGLEASRHQLLEFLAQSFGDNAAYVTIVFDAKGAPPGVSRTQTFRALSIRFAAKRESADDLIETLIDEAAEPEKLVIVSNDVRLKKAAGRRGAQAWSHEDLLDHFDKRQTGEPRPALAPEKTDGISPEEAKRWLKEFEDVEKDPALREFFEQDRFE